MPLLNAETRELKNFSEDAIPEYAILSHTWGSTDEEISIQDLGGMRTWDSATGPPDDSPKIVGWKKLTGACLQTLNDNLQYLWIDTCCIDKTSSAELSEAINSMFKWYADSRVCYAYLADVCAGTNPRSGQAIYDFRQSRWFTRGWTLQELLAPAEVRFFDARWLNLGGKYFLRKRISEITGNNVRYIGVRDSVSGVSWDPHSLIGSASVAEKMSWAAERRTTRAEDRAYSLLGIFDITMPMLYGEGDRAFVRLQENIMVATDDSTLLAWNYQAPWPQPTSVWDAMKPLILAPSPASFANCRGLIPLQTPRPTFSMTQRGLRLKAPIVMDKSHRELAYAILGCGPNKPPLSQTSIPELGDVRLRLMAIPLISSASAGQIIGDEYWRPFWSRPVLVTKGFFATDTYKPRTVHWKEITIRRPSAEYLMIDNPWLPLSLLTAAIHGGALVHAYPPRPIVFSRHVLLGTNQPAGSSGLSSLLGRPRRDGMSTGDAYSYQCPNTRRLAYVRIPGLDLLIYLLYELVIIPSSKLHARLQSGLWPREPQVRVYRLAAPAELEDLHEWFEAKGAPELHQLTGLIIHNVSTERTYTTDGPETSHFALDINYTYDHRESMDGSGERHTVEFMPVIKITPWAQAPESGARDTIFEKADT